jgi:DNA-binding NtrC family response regulator
LSPKNDRSPAGRILVVDDQENLCWVLARLLSERGHVVRTAQNGAQALRVAAVFDCQVAIVDFRLPDTSGTALIARLRSAMPRLRAILMTSYGSAALRDEVANGGLVAYFDKPFVNTQMIESVETALLEWVAA